jgi:hypothetical protein
MNFSSVSGARDYADRCAGNGEDVLLYINNDMIANEPEPEGWIIDYIVHDLEYWTCPLTTDLAETYTALTTNVMEAGNFGADDLPFWQAGFQTGYFFEHNFCPYYHSENDLVENCNMNYCAEVARLNMALLLSVTERPEPVDRFFLFASGEGNSLQASWNPLDETDIESYEVRFGTSPDELNEVHVTSDTVWNFPGLQEGTLYYASIRAINSMGNASAPVIRKARPASVTLDQGILIVAGSTGGLLDPPQEEIDLFYEGMCHNFLHETIDATALDEILLEDIGRYSTVLWHIDDPDLTSALLADHSDVLRNYIWLGGNFMFTGFKPARNFGTKETPAFFREGSFMYDCLGVAESYNQSSRLFSGGMPELSGWPEVHVDSTKMPIFNFHLPWVEVFTPAEHGETLYRYDTKYDTTTNQGSYFGLPVGVFPAGGQKQAVTLGFPLYYMDSIQSRELVYQVMTQLFGEEYLGVEENLTGSDPMMIVYPNPASEVVYFELLHDQDIPKEIHVLDLSGREAWMIPAVRQNIMQWDTREIPAGIYIYHVLAGDELITGKIILAP